MKAERVSYDVITPSAARGLIEAVYWKPAIRWHIDRIEVLNEIRFDTFRRNELGGKLSYRNAKAAMERGEEVWTAAHDDRQQGPERRQTYRGTNDLRINDMPPSLGFSTIFFGSSKKR